MLQRSRQKNLNLLASDAMPTLVKGFSSEEDKSLEEMRQKTLKQLELLRLRQVQYKTRCTGDFQDSSRNIQNVGSLFVMPADLKVESQNGNAHEKYPPNFSENKANTSGSVNNSHNSGHTLDIHKGPETLTVAVSTIEQHVPQSKNLENVSHRSRVMPTQEPTAGASDAVNINPNAEDMMDDSQKQAMLLRAFSGDADNMYDRSYDQVMRYNWRTHHGEGDSQGQQIEDYSSKAGHKDFAYRPRIEYCRDIYEDLTGEHERCSEKVTELSDSDADSVTDVITITDSPLEKSLNARTKLAAISKSSVKNDVFEQTRSARELASDLRSVSTRDIYSHDARGISHIGELESSASPHQTSSVEGTPKSILRHRKLIDDNVKVQSKYEHTPTTSRSRRRRGLNFSYSEINDSDSVGTKSKSVIFLDSVESSEQKEQGNGKTSERGTSKTKSSQGEDKAKLGPAEVKLRSLQSGRVVSEARKMPSQKIALSSETKSLCKMPHYVSPTNGSYIEECDLDEQETKNDRRVGSRDEKKRIPDETEGTKDRGVSKHTKLSASQTVAVKEVVQKNLLMHSGNDRKHASIVRELENRPKSVVFDVNKGVETKRSGNDSFVSKSYLDHSSTKEFSRLMDDRQGKPLLGYDWIAGLLDNERRDVSGEPDDLFEDVKEFRRQNKQECIGTSHVLSDVDLGRPFTPEVQNPTHTCIHGYSVNERLFTEPVNVDAKGTSFCPVCLSSRREPSQDSPGFVRVSIPRSTLESPYKIKPRRRRSFDPIDSCALSQHCMAGYECSRPSSIATATNLDLKHAAHGIKSQLITTEEEARKIADSVSKTSQPNLPRPLLLPNVSIPRIGQETNPEETMTLQSMSSQPSLSMSRSSTRDSRSVTAELLNASHSLRYQLQSLEKERGISSLSGQPNSTAFPLY